jgi:hypothetical protein
VNSQSSELVKEHKVASLMHKSIKPAIDRNRVLRANPNYYHRNHLSFPPQGGESTLIESVLTQKIKKIKKKHIN